MFSTWRRTDSLETASAAMLVGLDIGAQSVEAPDIDEDLEGRREAPRHDVPTYQKGGLGIAGPASPGRDEQLGVYLLGAAMELDTRLFELRGIVIDMDGTIYVGERLFPWTTTFLDALEEAGIQRLFLTNNSAESTAEYAAKLQRLGIPVDETEVLTAVWATIHYLKTETPYRRIYLLGTPGLRREFRDGGLTVVNDIETDAISDAPDAVVLGFDMTITYRRIRTAAELIQAGVPFIATHPDPVCPKENGLVPDCGSMIELLVPAAGQRPLIVGKPHSRMVDAALAHLGTTREQTAIIGDLLPTDMKMARENGLMGILVLSGESSKQDVEDCAFSPDLVLQNAGEFASLLRSGMNAGRRPVS